MHLLNPVHTRIDLRTVGVIVTKAEGGEGVTRC